MDVDTLNLLHYKVTSPYGDQLYFMENVQSGQFAFTTSESGNFMACFWLLNAPHSASLNVAQDWKTDRDYCISKCGKGNMSLSIEFEIKKKTYGSSQILAVVGALDELPAIPACKLCRAMAGCTGNCKQKMRMRNKRKL